jgi:hypothetical protein
MKGSAGHAVRPAGGAEGAPPSREVAGDAAPSYDEACSSACARCAAALLRSGASALIFGDRTRQELAAAKADVGRAAARHPRHRRVKAAISARLRRGDRRFAGRALSDTSAPRASASSALSAKACRGLAAGLGYA